MPTKGSLKRTIVSKSQPVSGKAPSPNRHTTSFSGCTSLEAMAKGTPTPKRAERTRIHPVARGVGLHHTAGERHDVPAVPDVDGVVA